MRGSLDTNVILRFLIGDVTEQYQAVAELLKQDGQLAVADLAIVEAAFVMERAYGMTRVDIAQALRGFMLLPVINCNRRLFDTVVPEYVAHHALSMEDCCLVAYAELTNAAPLYTFDQKLAHQATGTELIVA